MEGDYFICGEKELSFLKEKDARMKEAILRIGAIKRKVIPDLFTALVSSITAQQISSKAHETLWKRMLNGIGGMSAEKINSIEIEKLQSFGMSFKKAGYIKNAAAKIVSGEFDISALHNRDDEKVVETLTSLDGIGVWSAEMLMIFSMRRPNVLSFGDFAIQRGLRMIYHHRKITRALFEKYRRRFSPYCSAASLYIWAVSSGEYEGYRDFAPKNAKK